MERRSSRLNFQAINGKDREYILKKKNNILVIQIMITVESDL